jgi:hypothetical protein
MIFFATTPATSGESKISALDTAPRGAKPKALTLLSSTARLRVNSAAGKITVELPELPGELLAQPACVLKFSR